MTYYKVTRVDGTDFRTGTVDYGGALVSGEPVWHPRCRRPVRDFPSTYLSISVSPTGAMVGGGWPCRLFEVEPIGAAISGLVAHQDKRAVLAMRVIREIDSWRVFGPHGLTVASIIERASRLTVGEMEAMSKQRLHGADGWKSAWKDAWDSVWLDGIGSAASVATEAAYDSVVRSAWSVRDGHGFPHGWRMRDCVSGVALAHVVKNAASGRTFDALCEPWLSVIKDM